MEKKDSILVVLYNKRLIESTTLKTLQLEKHSNLRLVIYNNGPILVEDNEGFLDTLKKIFNDVVFIQDISNKPLSKLYNDFLEQYESKRYYIFDDDTIIPEGYFSESKDKSDITVPIIRTLSGDIVYPKVGSNVCINNEIKEDDFFYTIGSGLVIHETLLKKFSIFNMSLFDERYALYGVDVSIFRRILYLKKMGEDIAISVDKELTHSLSRIDEKQNSFRNKERLIDNVITLRHYPLSTIHSVIFFSKMLLKRLFLLKFSEVALMFIILYKGIHPRCSEK